MSRLLINLLVKNSENTDDKKVREDYGKLAGAVGICCNILLCVIKLIAGILTSSISIIADGLNNLSDMGSSVISIIGFKLAGKPADRDHPFGHGRMEYMSAFIVAVLIIIVGFELLTSSVKAIISNQNSPEYSAITIIILIISVLIKLWMFLFNNRLAKCISSSVLKATAQDCINDAISTSAILIAAGISMLIKLPFNLDAVMAVFVALFILWSGISTARSTINEILGGPPDVVLIKELENEICSFDAFIGIHDLLVHNYGPGRQFASVHVEVPHNANIVECHEQIDICERLVFEKTGVALVIHMDPIDINDETVSETRNAISELVSSIDSRLSIHDFRMTPNAKNRTNLIFDVVIPREFYMTSEDLGEKIRKKAAEINPTYCCVITFDNDFSGL